jgi:hypothetical protein
VHFEPVTLTKGSVRVISRNAMNKNGIVNLFRAQRVLDTFELTYKVMLIGIWSLRVDF